MKYAIIRYKKMLPIPPDTSGDTDLSQFIENVEARLPIVRQDGDVYHCTYPDGRMHAFQFHQIAGFYDSESDITLTRQELEDLREREW